MTKLYINNPGSSDARDTQIFKSSDFALAWYELIRLIGLPVDTDGVTVDSIEAAKANQGHNGTACFTAQSANYRTNKVWYVLRTAV